MQVGHVDCRWGWNWRQSKRLDGHIGCAAHTAAVSAQLIEPFGGGCISVSWRPGPSLLQQRSPCEELMLGE